MANAPLRFKAKKFQELKLEELYELLCLRTEIFVVEQQCIYNDLDRYDHFSLHALGWDAEGKLRAYARILYPSLDYYGKRTENTARIGRIVVDQSVRGRGEGRNITKFCLKEIEARYGKVDVELSAQSHLEKFYKDLGFERQGEPYDETGIMHVRMLRKG